MTVVLSLLRKFCAASYIERLIERMILHGELTSPATL